MTGQLEPKVMGLTFAAVAFFFDITGYVWHGLLSQPSIMNILYPRFWGDATLLLYGLVGSLVYAFAIGYVFAYAYNYFVVK